MYIRVNPLHKLNIHADVARFKQFGYILVCKLAQVTMHIC